ncbi:hypothetical protein B0H19DRAFT_1246903 [Mycena capillaripes]|nr:hypothetical protein B0H19DRAFT_1246903 [Mycena capillaripes]
MASVVQFSVDDSSPTVIYAPFGDTFSTPDLSAGWNPHWQDLGFSSAILGSTGSGTSLHITAFNGASLQIQWKGTGITLFGNVTQSSYSITIDNQPTDNTSADPANNTLIDIINLEDKLHSLSLTVQTDGGPDSLFQFDRALISAPPSPSNVSSSNFTQQTLNESSVALHGQWSFSDSSHQSTTIGDSASFQFTGTSFQLMGSTSPQAGDYSVQLDDGVTTVFSAKSSFSQPDSLLFFASGLDAEVNHTLKLVNIEGATVVIPVGAASVWALAETPSAPSSSASASSSPSSSASNSSALVQTGLPSGTIAALVLAGVLIFFVAICALLYFFLYRPYRRRQHLNRRPAKDDPDPDATSSILVVDIAPDTETTKKRFYDDIPVAGPSRDRTSKRSGFSKWKEEVEGGLGSWGRGALGIAFRHSDSTGRRDASGSSHDYDFGATSDGYKSTSSSSNGEYNGKGKGKGRERSRWSRRSRDKSSSPRFKLDLPMEPRSRSGSHHSNAPSAPADPSVISSLSYLSSPSLRPTNLPSTPSPIRPSAYPNTHSRVGSNGLLLAHVDEPQPPEREQEYRPPLPPLPPPSTSLPLPPEPAPITPPKDILSPPDSPKQDDRGSVREYDADDGRSILGDGTARIALRSLSPRTSEADHHTARSKRRPKEKKEKPLRSSPLANPSIDAPSPPDANTSHPDTNLSLRSTSPFQVDFDQTDRRAARLSTPSRVRFEEDAAARAEANVQSGEDQGRVSTGTDDNRRQPSRAPFRLTPSIDHLRDTSFLDFASSSEGSIMTRSNDYSSSSRSFSSLGPSGQSHWSTGANSNIASLVPPPQLQSRWSATTAPSSDFQHQGSGTGSSSDSNFPFPVSLPPSPHHPEGTFLQPPQSFSARLDLAGQPDSTLSSLNAHPIDLVSDAPTSPTESDVPMSISDIHFRHSDNEDQNGSHRHSALPAHPPLPPAPEDTSYIVQRTVGIHTPSPSIGHTFLGSPTPTATRFNTTPSSAATTSRPSPGSSGGGL